jgi:hypothetical protein
MYTCSPTIIKIKNLICKIKNFSVSLLFHHRLLLASLPRRYFIVLLLRRRLDGKYDLMIKNRVFSGITLPDPRRTNVRNEHNFCYTNDTATTRAPTHISQNVAAGGGANFVPPVHTPDFSNTFIGNSSSSK